MRFLLLISIIFFCSVLGHSQTVVSWGDLKFESTNEVWNEEFETVYQIPKFYKNTKKLDSSKILITGYVIPIDIQANYYILSASKYKPSCCFSPNMDESIDLQINFKTKPKIDDIVTVTGTLLINEDDILQPNYILEDAKIVEDKPIEISWEDLKLDSTSEIWNDELQTHTPQCHFNSKTTKLVGNQVEISGYIAPIDIEKNLYALTKTKITAHYLFHGYIPPNEIIDIKIQPDELPSISDEITISGIFVLNESDILELNIILVDAKIKN